MIFYFFLATLTKTCVRLDGKFKAHTGCDIDSCFKVFPLGLVSSPRPSVKIIALHVAVLAWETVGLDFLRRSVVDLDYYRG